MGRAARFSLLKSLAVSLLVMVLASHQRRSERGGKDPASAGETRHRNCDGRIQKDQAPPLPGTEGATTGTAGCLAFAPASSPSIAPPSKRRVVALSCRAGIPRLWSNSFHFRLLWARDSLSLESPFHHRQRPYLLHGAGNSRRACEWRQRGCEVCGRLLSCPAGPESVSDGDGGPSYQDDNCACARAGTRPSSASYQGHWDLRVSLLLEPRLPDFFFFFATRDC